MQDHINLAQFLHISCLSCTFLASKCKMVLPGVAPRTGICSWRPTRVMGKLTIGMICRQLLLCPLSLLPTFEIILMAPCVNASTNYSTRPNNYGIILCIKPNDTSLSSMTGSLFILIWSNHYVCFKIARL